MSDKREGFWTSWAKDGLFTLFMAAVLLIGLPTAFYLFLQAVG